MTSKEALKRLWQETAPATYMKDFDKKECCDVIERDLEKLARALKILDVFKREIFIDTEVQHTFSNDKKMIFIKESEEENKDIVSMQVSEEERLLIKEWLNNDGRN